MKPDELIELIEWYKSGEEVEVKGAVTGKWHVTWANGITIIHNREYRKAVKYSKPPNISPNQVVFVWDHVDHAECAVKRVFVGMLGELFICRPYGPNVPEDYPALSSWKYCRPFHHTTVDCPYCHFRSKSEQ